jgi:hypothetical protein
MAKPGRSASIGHRLPRNARRFPSQRSLGDRLSRFDTRAIKEPKRGGEKGRMKTATNRRTGILPVSIFSHPIKTPYPRKLSKPFQPIRGRGEIDPAFPSMFDVSLTTVSPLSPVQFPFRALSPIRVNSCNSRKTPSFKNKKLPNEPICEPELFYNHKGLSPSRTKPSPNTNPFFTLPTLRLLLFNPFPRFKPRV